MLLAEIRALLHAEIRALILAAIHALLLAQDALHTKLRAQIHAKKDVHQHVRLLIPVQSPAIVIIPVCAFEQSLNRSAFVERIEQGGNQRDFLPVIQIDNSDTKQHFQFFH